MIEQGKLIPAEITSIITEGIHVGIMRVQMIRAKKGNAEIEKTVEKTNGKISILNK